MDEKAKYILAMYRERIETFEFDELDVLGFLIFMREYFRADDFPSIYEFCDLVAHRFRNRGRVYKSIESAVGNDFKTDPVSGKIIGSKGVYGEIWTNEWQAVFRTYEIQYSERTIREITLCIISLAQKTMYVSGEIRGRLEVIIDYYNNIDLCYCQDLPDRLYVTFLRSGQWHLVNDPPQGVLHYPIMVKRIEGNLKLQYRDSFLN